MRIFDRCLREAYPTLNVNGWVLPSWLDYLRVIRASYPWWLRPFVRTRCEVAAHALIGLNLRVGAVDVAPDAMLKAREAGGKGGAQCRSS